MRGKRGTLFLLSVSLILISVLLTGCPKAPTVGEVAPKPVTPEAKPPEKPPAVVEKPRVPEVVAPKVMEEVIKKPAEIKEAAVKPVEVPKEAVAKAVPAVSPLQDIFFDTDLAIIKEDAKKDLEANAEWLKANPAVTITIEGHADERASNEYNLALGERRAKTTKDYLVSLGVSADRMKTISYGEERPFVLGHDESAWKWNRRSHFVLSP